MLTQTNEGSIAKDSRPSRWARAMRIEWLGQMVASLLWIISALTYGINAPGDWLQLGAASAWFMANVASLMSDNVD